jgi:zinc finger CCHC domain-containing protein 8
MRELGYPPGYLDAEYTDLPSGITIFGEEEKKEDTEDGEIREDNEELPEAPRKMSVEFPGINGPIPENADEARWTDGPSRSDLSRNRSSRRHHQPEQQTPPQQQRWSSRDEAPPGVEPSAYSQRYGSGAESAYPSYSPSYSHHDRRLSPRRNSSEKRDDESRHSRRRR